MKPTMVTTEVLWRDSVDWFFFKRLLLTRKFIKSWHDRTQLIPYKFYEVGDAGEQNPFCDLLQINHITHLSHFFLTSQLTGDLDITHTDQKDLARFDIITCFEVIEHLMNPLHFLTEARKSLKQDGVIFVSLPSRPPFLWTPHHYHEIGRKRFGWLCDAAGLEIVRHETHRITYHWTYYLTGVRPFLRLFFAKWNIYELKTKQP